MTTHSRPPQTTSPFLRLKKKLWVGTLLVDAALVAGFALFNPEQLKLCMTGIFLGLFYLWSLTFNAENPKKGVQFAFSTIRSCLFAYALVQLTHARANELAIVMSGFLSYKVILTVEYVVQALPAFRRTTPVKAEQ